MTKDKSIFIRNIYYMLSYAFTALQQSDDDRILTEQFDNIHSLFAAIFIKGIGRQLKQGLYREYVPRKEDLPLMHGKIDIPGTLKNRIEKKQRLSCEFDELSENNLMNQILKTTVMLLLRHDEVDAGLKSGLKKEMLLFSNVDEIDPLGIKWPSIRFQRNNQTYRMLLGICQLVIEGMLLTTDDGEYKLASFIDDQRMSRLYEKFILEYYLREHPQLAASASRIPWQLDDECDAMLPVMQTDIMLSNSGKILIIDAKYYAHATQIRYGKHTIHSANLYQIFTYVKNKEAELAGQPHEVSGMLLYAKTDEEICPESEYRMSGNTVAVRTLDLNGDFAAIRSQLDSIAERYFGI